MSKKKINRALVQDILSKGDGVKTVASEAVDWVISVAEEAAKNLAASGRKTPGGRLMAPRFAPSLMARQVFKEPEPALGEGDLVIQEAIPDRNHGEGWSDYHDWQQAVRTGATKLPYEEWKGNRLREMTEVEQVDKATRSTP